ALGGALQLPREPANLALDLTTIGDAFVVVVVGGMGSIPGAYLAALIIAEIKAICYGIGTVSMFGTTFSFSKLTLVVEFLVMAAVLIWRPWGLLGKPQGAVRSAAAAEAPMRPMSRTATWAVAAVAAAMLALPLLGESFPYLTVLMIDVLIAVLFATSLHFIMGPGGMYSFGHAAYFGLGAYGAALLFKAAGLSMGWAMALGPLVAGVGAVVFGWFCVRLSGVYLAMLTLAFAQIVWSVVFQWDAFTGGSNGVIGIWPSSWFEGNGYYYFALAVVAASIFLVWRIVFSPFGYAMRASRDSTLRAYALGIDVKSVQWIAFIISGLFAGLAGALFVFSKGSVSPDVISVSKSVDGLVMVLLGGLQTLVGPLVGAATFKLLQDHFMSLTTYWHALFGGVILLLVLAFPQGIAGYFKELFESRRLRRHRVTEQEKLHELA